MLEKYSRNVGMDSLNSVGSAGSCDSMESISSNHSALSDYDHLSAEERECLMFLEETIDSLDNEDDSGLSTDELETTNTPTNIPVSKQEKIPYSTADEKASPPAGEKATQKSSTVSNSEERTDEAFQFSKPSKGYTIFPRVVQVSNEMHSKQPSGTELVNPKNDQEKLWPEQPKSISPINQHTTDDSLASLILSPPKAFRDVPIIDKRRSVTDPTDAREIRLDRAIMKSAMISEVRSRESPPDMGLKGSQELHSHPLDRQSQLKQGPPTAPKPRTLPPHIVIKTSKGVVPHLDPQYRPRTFSAVERSSNRTNESITQKVPSSKEQEKMRLEALKKLGIQESSRKQEFITTGHSRTNVHLATDGTNQEGPHDATKKDVSPNQQDGSKSQTIIPIESTTIVPSLPDKDAINKNRLSVKLTSLGKADEPIVNHSLPSQKKTNNSSEDLLAGVKSDIFGRNSVKKSNQENMERLVNNSDRTSHSVQGIAIIPSTNEISHRSTPQINPALHPKKDSGTDPPASSGLQHSKNQMQNVSKSAESTKTSTVPAQTSPMVQDLAPVRDKKGESLSNPEYSLVSDSQESRRSPGLPHSKEALISQPSPEVIRRDEKEKSAADQSNRVSTSIPSEQPLRLPQGSVPGLRQINIKSSTLERSGIGLSSSMSSVEKETQKGGLSFFRKPLFSGNALRNNRPRPLSMGTGKDFANLEALSTEAESKEKRSFFSKPSRISAPVTSVKITPKGSTDEHRREALKKLGILKD